MKLSTWFPQTVPTYKGASWRPHHFTFDWDQPTADFVRSLSEKRWQSRIATYVIPGEFERLPMELSGRSLRFGHHKSGSGIRGNRKDFCLLSGVLRRNTLTVFYRRLELIGGLHYDLAVFNEVRLQVGAFKQVTVWALQSDTYCPSGCSNERLYSRLMEFYART